jgi:hypothetical protein
MRPPPLAAYLPSFIPPVTGVGGSLAPVANSYDSSGTFVERGRANSFKRKRTEEIDAIFDLSADYPPLTTPQRPTVDLGKVKGLMVAAASAAVEVRPMLDDPNLDSKVLLLGKLTLAILDTLGAAVESGLEPISAAANSRANGRGGAGNGGTMAPPIPAKTTPTPGLKELKEGLARADRESIMFDVDLGKNTMANRNGLASAFSATVRKTAIDTAVAAGKDPAEAVRVMDDVISCVSDMEFIGSASKRFINNRNNDDNCNNTFCTMPVKLRFDDRNSRVHFEKSMREYCNLRANISLPKPIRLEQAAFLSSLRERYPGDAVTVRPDTASGYLYALRKEGGAGPWLKCSERLHLSPGIMLPTFVPRKTISLAPAVEVGEAGEMLVAEPEASTGDGNGTQTQS